MDYSWKDGARTHGLKIGAVAPALEKIEAKHGAITPTDILREARKQRSPLHNWFEWDDTKAGEQHRLTQARELIRAVEVTIVTGDRPVVFRAFVHMGEAYESTISVLSVVDSREALLASALRELTAFRMKYKTLKELAGVFKAMDEVAA